jgi:hypothetical protein
VSLRTVGLMAVSGVLALSLTACSSDGAYQPPGGVDGPPTSEGAAAPAAAAAPATADATSAEACSKIDQAALVTAFGPLVDLRPDPSATNSGITKVGCSLVFGSPTERIPVDIDIRTGTPAVIADTFKGLRGVTERGAKTTKVSGVGQQAYRFANGIATHLIVLDKGVYLDYAVVTGALDKVPSGLDQAVTASAKATLPRLAAK